MASFVGRETEVARLDEAVRRGQGGSGSLVLIGGEAGVGKSRLADAVAAQRGARVLRGRASQGDSSSYGMLVTALRSQLRADPDAFADLGPLTPHLAVLMPELGPAVEQSDRATLFEALRQTLAHIAGPDSLVVILDDLHWSDTATLELLCRLAEPLSEMPVVILCTYRTDGLPRDHSLRKMRNELRRTGRLDEILLTPFTPEETAGLLGDILGAPPAGSLVRVVQDRTLGVPFFVEELGRALAAASLLVDGGGGLELAREGEVPIPDTVRDAVLVGLADLSSDGREAADAAAVAGDVFEIDLLAGLVGDESVAELFAVGILREDEPGRACFRHALSRESIYADIPWLRRRSLHRRVAEALEAGRAPAAAKATQWLGARELGKAREALLAAAVESESKYAYRDAAEFGRQALDLWHEGASDAHDTRRIEALAHYATCSELAGDVNEAIRAWRELCEIRASRRERLALASAQRRLAAAYDLRGEREQAFAARRVAAEAFVEGGELGEASLDHLAMANQLRHGARHGEAVELARLAGAEAAQAERLDVRARALALEGVALAKGGDYDAGLATVRQSIAFGLEHDLGPVVAELYQRLSVVLYDAADYRAAADALDTALDLCRIDGTASTEEACVSCLAYVLRDLGEWRRAAEVCGDLISSGRSVFVAEGLLGSIHAYQGRIGSARRLLASCLAEATRLDHYSMTVDSLSGLAFVAAVEGAHEEAVRHSAALVRRWSESEDHHYALSGLRWSAAYLARRGDRAAARSCTDALTTIASATGQPEAVAAVAHAIAELAFLDGDADTAAAQLLNALELHRSIEMPFVRAQIELRAGVAIGASGDRDAAVERIASAYRTARKLGARPLAGEAAREAAALGGSVVERLGRGAAGEADGTGLSRREREVIRLVVVGRTNREIAQTLFLSPRTVDMHVRNILRKLDCRSRVEAANRAHELGLVG